MTGIVDQVRERLQVIGYQRAAELTGLHRVHLWRNFKPGANPKLETIAAVLPHVGLELTIQESRPCHSPL